MDEINLTEAEVEALRAIRDGVDLISLVGDLMIRKLVDSSASGHRLILGLRGRNLIHPGFGDYYLTPSGRAVVERLGAENG